MKYTIPHPVPLKLLQLSKAQILEFLNCQADNIDFLIRHPKNFPLVGVLSGTLRDLPAYFHKDNVEELTSFANSVSFPVSAPAPGADTEMLSEHNVQKLQGIRNQIQNCIKSFKNCPCDTFSVPPGIVPEGTLLKFAEVFTDDGQIKIENTYENFLAAHQAIEPPPHILNTKAIEQEEPQSEGLNFIWHSPR